MRTIATLLFLSLFFLEKNKAQTPSIDKTDIAAAEKIVGLNFTDAERDSLLGEVMDNLLSVKAIHGQNLSNDVPPALYFDPIPTDFKPRDRRPETIKTWATEQNIVMPKNKADLAFYSIRQLAGLIRSKKISAVGLTQFFYRKA
ncbi:MAG: hypothetical protein HC817_16050 [Saprospiraceae bacterium]|nr:hypothetical protein [Saprospiraceae bacterium]